MYLFCFIHKHRSCLTFRINDFECVITIYLRSFPGYEMETDKGKTCGSASDVINNANEKRREKDRRSGIAKRIYGAFALGPF